MNLIPGPRSGCWQRYCRLTDFGADVIFVKIAKNDIAPAMNLIATSSLKGRPELASMLEGYDYPAILLTNDYRILAHNQLYQTAFGRIPQQGTAFCYQVSHAYDKPCDLAGEDCPLKNARISGGKERVLHIHQTSKGREHIEVELLPIRNEAGATEYFVELMKPVPLASGGAGKQSMVGSSPAFMRMLDRIARVGKSDAAVLLLGESGTGKELAARAIHESSWRKNKPLITLECSGLTDSLFESELFGYTKGAFTGANNSKKGLVELAHGGTLFLDEIADVPMSMQVKLLRLLENRTFRALGSTEVKHSDFRLICATHKNIQSLVEEEQFRLDLYHRINVFPIHIPALQQRLEDLPQIAEALLRKLQPERKFLLHDSALQFLATLPLKGNIRELRNILNRALILAEGNTIDRQLLRECLAIGTEDHTAAERPQGENLSRKWVDLKTVEQNYLLEMSAAFAGDMQKMADTLGISARSLYRKLREVRGKSQ